MSFAFNKVFWKDSHISLGCKLVPVQYREYRNDPLIITSKIVVFVTSSFND